MNTQIELSTLYTPYTLDTYQTFNFENVEEQMMEYYNDLHQTEKNYDDFIWEYDTDTYLQDLAKSLVTLLNDNILDTVIEAVHYNGKAYSPKEYNFKTDDTDLIFTVNEKNLDEYITKHETAYHTEKLQDRPGFWWMGNEAETKLAFYLHHKTQNEYEPFTYMMDQFDQVDALEYVNIT